MGWRDVEFSGSDSAERVRRLQAFCAESADADANDPNAFDALLIIGGVDSYHSELSQAVLKYLFLGSSGQELLGAQVIPQEHDRLEDVVLLLTRRRAAIFYSSESDAAVTVLPTIAQWRNVTEYTIHDAMDPDEQEARKVRAFKQMVAGVRRVGIPYGADAAGRDLQDPMVPEKWPLLQAYALDEGDGAKGKGFFTMRHAVVNTTRVLREELAQLDDFGATRVAKEVPPLLTHHFDQFLLKLDHAETPAVRAARSESDVGEDLLSFYEFGTTQHEARGLAPAPHRGSRVLFGARTAQAATTASSSSVYLRNAGGTRAASHMLVQSEDPFSGVRFTRTYFLATGRSAPRVVDEDALVHRDADDVDAGKRRGSGDDDTGDNSADTRALIDLYVRLLRGFRRAVRAFADEASRSSPSPSLDACLTAAKKEALRELRGAHVSGLDDAFIEKHLMVDAESLDACGRGTRFPGQKWNLVYLSCELQNVSSPLDARETLGSLVVGDTLLFQRSPRRPTSSEPLFLNTTASFAYFRCWIQPGREFESVKAQLAVLQSGFMLQSPALQLGQPMAPLDASLDEASGAADDPASSIAPATATPALTSVGLSRATLLLESDELPQLHGSMQLFTGGFCFKTPHVIPLMVSFAKHVAGFRVLSTPYEELVLLQLELKGDGNHADGDTPLSRALPFRTASRVIAFPLLAGTRFQEEIVHALRVWKATAERLGIPFYRPHDLVQFDGETPRDDGRASASASSELSPLFAKACASLVRRPSASDRVVDALFPRWFIPKDANPNTTLPKPRRGGDRAKTVVPLTIVLGLPGSSAASIACTICDVSSAATDWTRVDVDGREASAQQDPDSYAAAQIQQRVGAALDRILDASTSELPPRILLCVVAYVDAVTVAAAIKARHSTWSLPTKIASVIGCVSATNAYLPDASGAQDALPRLFDQLASGFATHVVVTHSSDVPASALGRLRYHIDQTNPFADIHVLSSDVFEGSLAPLLCVDRFESAYYANYREAQHPDWATSPNYKPETDPAVAPQSVRFELAAGIEKARFLQSVGKTLTPHAAMTKSMDKIHPMDPQLMARQQQSVKGGIRLAQSLAADKVLAQQRQQQQDDVEAYGECWCVEALLSFAGDADTVYEYVSTGSYARMRVVNHANQKPPSLEVKITGRVLQPAKIQQLILGCYVNLDGAVRPLKTKVTLTIEEKREIQKLHIMDELPEGFYYDGVTYIDQFGGRHEFHPRMNEFIEEHVRSRNEKTTKHNAHVEENRKSQQAYVRQIV